MIEELNSLSTGLVGREAEYDMIARAITTLEAGVGGVVLVEGVGGIGKSALLSEFHRYAEGRRFPTFVGTSASPDRDRPFGAIFDALGCTADSDDPRRRALRDLTSVRGLAAPWEREGSIVRFAVQDALVNLVERELAVGPATLILDDLQWADAASLGAVAAIALLARTSPLLVVLATRPVPRRAELADLLRDLRPEAISMPLAPLSAADSLELIKARGLGRTLPFPADRLGGNPFLLVSAIGATDSANAHRHPEAEIRWAILGRLDGLTTSTVEVLRVAAAFGGPFDADDLNLVHSAPALDVLAALDEASRAGVLVAAGPRLGFVHDLVREAMLDEMSEPLRCGLHRVIWRAMAAAGRAPSSFANHIVRTAAPGDREAVAELRRAGIELAETDPSRASAYLGHAAELAVPLPWAERGDVAADLAEVLRLAGRLADVVAVVEEAVEWPVPAEQLARLEYTGAAALRFLGRVPEATTKLRRAISRQTMPAEMTSWAWSLIAGSEVFSLASPDDLKTATNEARRFAEISNDRAALVQSWCATSYVAWFTGHLDEAITSAETAVELGSTLGNATWPAPALAHAVALIAASDPERAIATITPWGRRAEQCGDLWALSRMEMVIVMAMFVMGEWDSISGHCDSIVRIGRETEGANGQPLAQAVAGLIACRRGDLGLARRLAADGHRIAESPCIDPLGLPFLGALDAELAEADGDALAGRLILDATFDFAAAVSPVANFWLGAAVARRAIEADEVARFDIVVASLHLATANESSAGWHKLSEAMGRHDAAAVEAHADHAVVGRLPFHQRDALLIAAALYRRSRDAVAAMRCIAAAREIDRLLGVPGADVSVAAPSLRRPSFGPGSLTPAEQAVLKLVSSGLTNAAIAERLVLSKRTVESHVSRMYLKLGVATRVELARCELDPQIRG